MRVAHERRVTAGDAVIEPAIHQVLVPRAGRDSRQAGECRIARQGGEDAALVIMLVAAEEEEPVLNDGSANPTPGLAAHEKRVGRQRVALKAGIGRHVMVAEKEKSAAV